MKRSTFFGVLTALVGFPRLLAAQVTSYPATRSQRAVFRSMAATYTLSPTPVLQTPVLVFWNGLLLLEGEDYLLAGRTIALPKGSRLAEDPTPLIQVFYTSQG